MEKAFVIRDMKSFEGSSLSELDRKFFGEQSLPSALSPEQLSTSRASIDAAAHCSDGRLCIPAALCLSADPISPSLGSSMHTVTPQGTDGHLAVPLQGKSSTPQVHLRRQEKAAGFDRSYGDLTASQMSWDVSLIKSENSPKPGLESSALEATWSPNPHSTHHSIGDVSP
ncbi:uncharacterized protein ACO6RY_08337 [Pungitius sinensis]